MDHLDQVLSRRVAGVRLACEHDHGGTLGIVEQPREPRRVGEQQRGALVGGEAPREADDQRVGVGLGDQVRDARDCRLALAVAPVLLHHSVVEFLQQPLLELLAHAPELGVGDLLDAIPVIGIEQFVVPLVEAHVEQVVPLAGEKRLQVHAVGDVRHRVLLGRYLRPHRALHDRGHLAVDARDAVVETRALQCQRGHVEAAVGLRDAAEREQFVHRDAEALGEAAEVGLEQRGIEDIVSGRHRGVRGEHRARGDDLQRACQGVALLHVLAAALQHQEGRVALVDVPRGGLQAEAAQHARAADAEHYLLLQAHLATAAVELARDATVRLAVLGHVGVQEVETDMADARLPDVHPDAASRKIEVDAQALAVDVHRLDRHVAEIRGHDLRDLVAVAVDGLGEVAVVVQQADADEGNAEVAGSLAVVAGEDAEAAGVDREALVQPELGAEVCDEVVVRIQELPALGPRVAFHVGVEAAQHAPVFLEVAAVLGGLVEDGLRHAAQEYARIGAARGPQRAVQAREQAAHAPVPAVDQVVRELVEPRQRRRDAGLDFQGESTACHGSGCSRKLRGKYIGAAAALWRLRTRNVSFTQQESRQMPRRWRRGRAARRRARCGATRNRLACP